MPQSAAEYDPFGEPIMAPAGTPYGFTGELTDGNGLVARGTSCQYLHYNWIWIGCRQSVLKRQAHHGYHRGDDTHRTPAPD